MFYNENHDKIIDILEKRNYANVGYLAQNIHVSEPTIRRALKVLENNGKIKRTFGGAILSTEINKEVPLVLREQENIIQKQEIATIAANYIQDGQLIFVDASSKYFVICMILISFISCRLIDYSTIYPTEKINLFGKINR